MTMARSPLATGPDNAGSSPFPKVRLRAGPACPPGGFRSLSDVAAYLGVSPRTVRRLINDGELVAHRVRGRLRVSDIDLASYLRQVQGAV